MAVDLCVDHAWGFMASGVEDAPGCISDCRANFIKSLEPEYTALGSICEALTSDNQTTGTLLRTLYCCSSQRCGVNNLEGLGRDPNTNWFINACRSIGYESIVDPGPPSPGYICAYGSLYGTQFQCEDALPTTTSANSAVSISSTEFIIEDITPFTPISPTLSSFTTIRSPMPAMTTISSDHPTSTSATLNAATDQGNGGDDSSALSTGIRVTIALSIIAGVVVIIALVTWHIRFREHIRNRRLVSRPIKSISFPGPTDSFTPLVSPTNSYTSPPLTPPRRLQERRFLISRALSRHSHSQDPARVPLSPIRPPIKTRSAEGSLRATSPTPTSTPASPRYFRGHHRGNALSGNINSSIASLNNFPNTSMDTTLDGRIFPSFDPQPPPRVYGPPPLVGLISPGPPPNKALPKTPLNGRDSPKSPLFPLSVAMLAYGSSASMGSSIRPQSPLAESHECEKIEEDASEYDRGSAAAVGGPDTASKPPRRIRHMRSLLNQVNLDLVKER